MENQQPKPFENTNQLEKHTKVNIGNKIYIVERHFNGGRSLAEAVYEAVKNEAKRRDMGSIAKL